MKIAVRFAISITIPLVTLSLFFGYLYHRRSREMLREELSREGRAIALVVGIAVEDYLRDRQLNDLEQLIDRISGYERVLGLRIFDVRGGLIYQSKVLDQYPFRHWGELQSVLREHKPAQTRRQFGNEVAAGFVFPLFHPPGTLVGAVQVLQLESYMREDARAMLGFIVLLSLATVIASVFMVIVVTRFSVAQPIDRLMRSVREVAAGHLSARVRVDGEDELGRLAREFNNMCERLEASQRSLAAEQAERRKVETHLRGAERLAGLGRLAAGLAHEIGTPLNVISGRAESVLRSGTTHEATQKNLRVISEQIDRIVEIVRDMLDFARKRPVRREPTDLGAALNSVLNLASTQLDRENVRVDLTMPRDLPPLVADPHQLQQVFLNLLINAVDAMDQGGVLRIAVEQRELIRPGTGGPPCTMAAVVFEDSGTGIAPENRDHVFDPFFTTKESGKGTGLGLSVSYGIVEEHEGWIDLESEPGKGTRVTVYLPFGLEARESPLIESGAA